MAVSEKTVNKYTGILAGLGCTDITHANEHDKGELSFTYVVGCCGVQETHRWTVLTTRIRLTGELLCPTCMAVKRSNKKDEIRSARPQFTPKQRQSMYVANRISHLGQLLKLK